MDCIMIKWFFEGGGSPFSHNIEVKDTFSEIQLQNYTPVQPDYGGSGPFITVKDKCQTTDGQYSRLCILISSYFVLFYVCFMYYCFKVTTKIKMCCQTAWPKFCKKREKN